MVLFKGSHFPMMFLMPTNDGLIFWVIFHGSFSLNSMESLKRYLVFVVLETVFIFHHMWDNPEPIDLIFFKKVKTTNQILSTLVQVNLFTVFLFFFVFSRFSCFIGRIPWLFRRCVFWDGSRPTYHCHIWGKHP